MRTNLIRFGCRPVTSFSYKISRKGKQELQIYNFERIYQSGIETRIERKILKPVFGYTISDFSVLIIKNIIFTFHTHNIPERA